MNEHSVMGQHLVIAALVLSGAACASRSAIDPAELHLTETALLEARQVGAERFAGQVLREAQERLALARELSDAGHDERAARLLEEARVLAMRAEAETLARQTIDAAEVVEESLSAMERALAVDAADAP